MSSFIISEKHANKIVSALIESSYIIKLEAQSFLDMMMIINHKSVNARYKSQELYIKNKFKFEDNGFDNESSEFLIGIVKIIDCYQYQSCEFEEFEKTLVFRILSDFKEKLTSKFKEYLVSIGIDNGNRWEYKKSYDLPFYDDYDWAI